MTQDNVAAQIQSGFQDPYQTRINFTTTITYLDATLSLQVTPQITEAGTVIMEISVQKTEPATGLAIEGSAGTPLSDAHAKNRLMVRDAETSVIAVFTRPRKTTPGRGCHSSTRFRFIGSLSGRTTSTRRTMSC